MSDPCRKAPCFHGGSLLRALLVLFIGFDLVSDVGAAAAFMLRLLHSSLFDRVCNPLFFVSYIPIPTTRIITAYVELLRTGYVDFLRQLTYIHEESSGAAPFSRFSRLSNYKKLCIFSL